MSSGTVTVTVKYLVTLADKTGKRTEEVSLGPRSTLRDLSAWLKEERDIGLPDPRILTVLNGKGWDQYPEKLDTALSEGDTVLLFPPIAGG